MFGAKRVWVSSARPENCKERNLETFLTGFLETAEGVGIHVADEGYSRFDFRDEATGSSFDV
jgi:hypothetical protein